MSEKRKSINVWRNLKGMELQDAIDRFTTMSSAEVEEYIRSNGGDPEGIRRRGGELARKLMAERQANAWQGEVVKKQETFRETLAAAKSRIRLTRDELLARIDAALRLLQSTGPVTANFRKKVTETASDEQLQALLDEIELLLKLNEKP